MSGKFYTAAGLVLALVLFLAVNIFGNAALVGSRLDLTEHELFTLSDGTRNTLHKLGEPVTLRLYLSQKLATRLPSVTSYASRVRELLEEYALVSEGKVKVLVIDPEPFSDEEDRAVGYGVKGVPLSDGESTFYFGLVGTNVLDDVEVIAYLAPDRAEFIEYDITKMIYALGNPKRKVVGLLSTLPLDGMTRQATMAGRAPRPWMIMEQMQQLFEVRRVAKDAKKIDDSIDVLMLVHPKRLPEQTQYAIDQFVLRGGRALVFVDPNSEADATQGIPGMPPLPQPSDLGRLLEAWGLSLDPKHAVGDLQLSLKVRSQQGGRAVTAAYPPWFNVPPRLQNADDIVTGQLGNLTFASPGALVTVPEAGTTVTALVRSAADAMLIKTDLIGPMADLQNLLRIYKPGGKQVALAVRVQGRVKSAFPDGPPQASKPATASKPGAKAGGTDQAGPAKKPAAGPAHLAESGAEGVNLIVIADTDLLQDQFWVQAQDFLGTRLAVPISANANLVTNALDNLAGSSDLINVRSRGRFLRPFTRVNALRKEAQVKFRDKETQLLKKLESAEKRLKELQSTKQEGALVLSAAQREEIAKFRQERLRIRKELRTVRRELRKNIESLEGWLKFINIGLVPLLIGIGGLVLGIYRLRRRRSGAAPPTTSGSAAKTTPDSTPSTAGARA